jgi:hypothetical protein
MGSPAVAIRKAGPAALVVEQVVVQGVQAGLRLAVLKAGGVQVAACLPVAE